MFGEIHHQYSIYKNIELPWVPADTEDRYHKNLESQYQLLKDNNWIDNHFTYKFNSHGFRCDEFNTAPSIMFIGCSNTCGIGIPIESSWSYIVAKSMGLQYVNLGIGATGPDTSFRLAHHYIPQIQPKLVVYLEPPPGRFSMLSGDNRIYDFMVGSVAHLDTRFSTYYDHWLSMQENIDIHSIKHELAISALCQRNNTKFIYLHSLEFFGVDLARDLMHHGVKSNKIFSELVLNKINQCN